MEAISISCGIRQSHGKNGKNRSKAFSINCLKLLYIILTFCCLLLVLLLLVGWLVGWMYSFSLLWVCVLPLFSTLNLTFSSMLIDLPFCAVFSRCISRSSSLFSFFCFSSFYFLCLSACIATWISEFRYAPTLPCVYCMWIENIQTYNHTKLILIDLISLLNYNTWSIGSSFDNIFHRSQTTSHHSLSPSKQMEIKRTSAQMIENIRHQV